MLTSRRQIFFSVYLSAFIALALTISIIRYPKDAFEASLYGLKLWFEVVLPALLPFFAMADIMMGLGVVHFLGVLLEPIMKSLFRLPGVGGFAVAMGLASGYPIGAKITGRLRRQNLCTQVEAERLVSFANTADPLFMVGAVAVGMFGMPEIGLTIAIAHYSAVILVGFLMRFHGGCGPDSQAKQTEPGYLGRAFRELVKARMNDGRPFGHLFNDAVRETFGAMLFVGGCIMMFSVLIRVLTVSGFVSHLSGWLLSVFATTGVSADIIHTFISGLFEITIGTQNASQSQAPLIQKVMAASAVIAWSGLSVHAQVAAMVHGTDIRMWPYLLARFAHAFLAATITVLLMGPASGVVHTFTSLPVSSGFVVTEPSFLTRFWASMQLSIGLCGGLFAIGLLVSLSQRVSFFWITKSRR